MPAPVDYLRPEVIAAVERLDLRARGVVEGFLAGLNRSPFHGASVQFSEHRRYAPGDEPRLIDQTVLAKTERLFIRKFEAETNLQAWLAVDVSASMNYPPRGDTQVQPRRPAKLDYAITLAAALGWLMVGQQDAVGLMAFDDAVRAWLEPRSTRRHLQVMLAALAALAPAPPAARAAPPPGLADALHTLARRAHHRGLVIVLSDLLADPDPVLDALRHLRFRGHELVVIQVLDVTERHFDLHGACRLTDPESDAQLDVEAEAVREAYVAALSDLQQRYRTELAAAHGDFVVVDTLTAYDAALRGFLQARLQAG